jgi:hypothetical protein
MLYRSMLSTWSECVSIYCPCGQSVSRYVVLVYAVYMLRMNRHDCPMWSECPTICCIGLWDPMLSECLAICCIGLWDPMLSECLAVCCISICCLHARTESAQLPMWSECITIYFHVVRVYPRILPMWSECLMIWCVSPCGLHGQNESAHIGHVVGAHHDMVH